MDDNNYENIEIDVVTIKPSPSMMRIAENIAALQAKYLLLEKAERLRQQQVPVADDMELSHRTK